MESHSNGADSEAQQPIQEAESPADELPSGNDALDQQPSNVVEDILNNDKEPSKRHQQATSSTDDGSSDDTQFFQCNICFDPVRQPVVTLCGHLFCWPCIYRWFEESPSCPVCKAGASKDNLIPIYGRNSEGNITTDPRDTIPERPAAQRPAPMPHSHPFENLFQNHFAQGGISFSAGFSPFGFHMTWPNTPDVPLTEQQQHQLLLSRVLFLVGIVTLLILMFL